MSTTVWALARARDTARDRDRDRAMASARTRDRAIAMASARTRPPLLSLAQVPAGALALIAGYGYDVGSGGRRWAQVQAYYHSCGYGYMYRHG